MLTEGEKVSEPLIISCANYKGGVGKTTLTAVLAAGLAIRRNRRVLVFDADPQANLTEIFLSERDLYNAIGTAERLGHKFSLEYVVEPKASIPFKVLVANNLLLVPSKPSYMGLVSSAIPITGDLVNLFKKQLIKKSEKIEVDYIFLDLPPQMYGLVRPLIRAADLLIVPVSKSPFALDAIKYLLEDILRTEHDERPRFLGAVLVRFRTNETREIQNYKMRAEQIIDRVFENCGLIPALKQSGLPMVFDKVLYYHQKLSHIKAGLFGVSYFVRLLRGEFKGSAEVIDMIDPLLEEFEERVAKLKPSIS